jgi:signal transduction histidine kinase
MSTEHSSALPPAASAAAEKPARKRHRLFWKILTLFWLTLGATIIINIFITRQIYEIELEKRFSDSRVQSLTEDAVTIFESGGAKTFIRWARKQRRESGVHILLKDEQGKALFDRFQLPKTPPELAPTPISRTIRAEDKRIYTVELHFTREAASNLRRPQPFHWLRWLSTFVIIAFASWLLSRHLGRPIDALSQASRAFAQGDLGARVPLHIKKRKDELGQLATDFDDMAEETGKLIGQQRQLLRDISHEIRTPLTRQRLLLELGRRKGADSEFIEQLEQQNEKVDRLLSELLSLERMDNPLAKRELIDLVTLTTYIVEQCNLEAEAKSIQLALLHSRPRDQSLSLQISGNPSLIERAIENIVRNAIHYSPAGGIVTVTLSMDQAAQATICVEDNGPGVNEENLEKIFHPFFRDDQARKEGAGGIGLGLSIARKAALLHEGSISAYRRPEGGLKVVMRLPTNAQKPNTIRIPPQR